MTTLTDAVARAIRKIRVPVPLPKGEIWIGEDTAEAQARAAIAEFCRYLREIDALTLASVDTAYWSAEGRTSMDDMQVALRALANHIEGGEGK